MSATEISYVISTNEDWEDSLTIDDGGDPPDSIDLTGSSFRAQIRPAMESALVLLEASTANGLLVVGSPASAGNLAWNVPRDVTKQLDPGEYVYDMIWTKADGSRQRLLVGQITVEQGVTRP